MADDSGGQSLMGFIVGGLVVFAVIVGIFLYQGGQVGGGKTAVIKAPITTGSSK